MVSLRDVLKFKKFQTSKKIGSGWVGPGPFWIKIRILENQEKKQKSFMIIEFKKKKNGQGVGE